MNVGFSRARGTLLPSWPLQDLDKCSFAKYTKFDLILAPKHFVDIWLSIKKIYFHSSNLHIFMVIGNKATFLLHSARAKMVKLSFKVNISCKITTHGKLLRSCSNNNVSLLMCIVVLQGKVSSCETVAT